MKKRHWHYDEIGQDEEASRLMPGFEIQYVVTSDHVPNNHRAVFGHCVFPPKSQHYPHQSNNVDKVLYIIKGRVVNGAVDDQGNVTEQECGPGMMTFINAGLVHWTRNPYDEPCEFVFSYYGASSLGASGYVDFKDRVPIDNTPITGAVTRKLQSK